MKPPATRPYAPFRDPRPARPGEQGLMPRRYGWGVRLLSFTAFTYVAFAFVNERVGHWIVTSDGTAPLWLSHWSEYAVILAFGLWRIWSERNPYTRKRLAFLTAAVTVFWWGLPYLFPLPEPHLGQLPGQPVLPSLHTPATVTFFLVLFLVFLFGRRVICGWNCPCVGIRETVGFAFRDKTLRSPTAWRWRHLKWLFFGLYLVAFALILMPGAPYVGEYYGGFLALVAVTYFGSFFFTPLTGNRAYCRYLCPYGATFGLLNRLGFYTLTLDQKKCLDCRRCEAVCDMGIPVWQEGKTQGHVKGIEDCMGCARCVLACPVDALEIRDVRHLLHPGLRKTASALTHDAPRRLVNRRDPSSRPPKRRVHDWEETTLPLSPETLREAAARCLDCGTPGCRIACPLANRIPEWLEATKHGNFREAVKILYDRNPFPEICGRLCPQHRLCEGGCTLAAHGGAVTIGAVERSLGDMAAKEGWWTEILPPFHPEQGRENSVAIIGAGPAGLACAMALRQAGHSVTLFDRAEKPGGLLASAIPSFKLPSSVLQHVVLRLERAGVRFRLGQALTGEDVVRSRDTYGAVVLATGAQRPRPVKLPGSQRSGVWPALTFLSESRRLAESPLKWQDLAGRHILVLGGGDTAMDCARSALRRGARVTIAYRKGPELMRASPTEIAAARAEGAEFRFHLSPVAIDEAGTPHRKQVHFSRKTKDKTEKVVLGADGVVLAFGFQATPPADLGAYGITMREDGTISTDEAGRTALPRLYAIGDVSHGPDLVVTAMAAGQRTARAILAEG